MATAIEIDGRPANRERLAERIVAERVHSADLLARDGRIHGLTEHLTWLAEEFENAQSIAPDSAAIRRALERFLHDEPESGPLRVELYRAPDSSVRTLIRGRNATSFPEVVRLRASVDFEKKANHLPQLPVQKGSEIVMSSANGMVRGSSLGPIGLITGGRIVWTEHANAVRTVGHLEKALHAEQITTVTLRVQEHELELFDAAFIVCADGVTAVERIADSGLDLNHARLLDVRRAWGAVEWEHP